MDTKKRKGKKKMWIVLLVFICIIASGLIVTLLITAPGRHELKEMNIQDINFKKLHDGIYIGEYKGSKDHFRDTRVQVTISSGKVSEIKVLKGNLDKEGHPVKMNDNLTIDNLSDNVIQEQSLQVDVISGATLTSKAHLKAVEDALEQAQNP